MTISELKSESKDLIAIPMEVLKKFGIWDLKTGKMVAVVTAKDRKLAEAAHRAAQNG